MATPDLASLIAEAPAPEGAGAPASGEEAMMDEAPIDSDTEMALLSDMGIDPSEEALEAFKALVELTLGE